MAKFNIFAKTKVAAFSPVVTEAVPSGLTHEGGSGHARDTRSELFLLAVTTMVGEHTFYESADKRDTRYAELVARAAVEHPDWTARFLRWLRADGAMRTAALVGAAEYVRARLAAAGTRAARQHETADPAGQFEGDTLSYSVISNRAVIDSVLQRADEPGELLAYWTSVHGRAVPKPVKRGVADAVARLYDERSLLKWDSDARGWRMGDVIDFAHPSPRAQWQGDLFAHALDRRHKRDNPIPPSLGTLIARAELMAWPVEKRRDLFAGPETGTAVSLLRQAGMTWEALAGWLQGPLTARAWEAMIPSMGYMALLRNLRNFDQAGVSDEVAERVCARLADPEQVAKSRQFPMRFLSAHRAAPSLRWGHALDKALTASLANVPALTGRTLVLIDTSGSMNAGFGKDGSLLRWDAAVVFGLAVASRCAHADVVSFSNGYGGRPDTKVFPLRKGESLLRSVDRWRSDGYFIGGGTDTPGAIREHLRPRFHDRLLILTDEQTTGHVEGVVPATTPLYTWNLAGYRTGHAPSGVANRHTFGGLTDAAFRMVPLLEAGRDADWPF